MIRVGVDWGSSSFRAYRFDVAGVLVDELSAEKGIREIHPATQTQFEQDLFELIGDWLTDGDIVLLSGMITSRSGWQETPYLTCPVDVSTIVKFAHCKSVRNVELRFLPGLNQLVPVPDVMRGEELQLLGAVNTAEDSVVILPGTHSKWAVMNGSVLSSFRTVITGELFEIVRKNSLVGAVISSDSFDKVSFLEGVSAGYETQTIVADLFSLRSSVLLGQQNSDSQHSRLSGMLIGNEIREGLQLTAKVSNVVLVGAKSLCALYQMAFNQIGISVTLYKEVAAVSGFQKLSASFSQQGS